MKRYFFFMLLMLTIFVLALTGCVSSPTPTSQQVPPVTNTTYPPPGQTGYPGPNQAYPATGQPKVAATGTLIPKNLAPISNQVGLIKGVLKVTPPDPEGVFPGIYLGNINRDAKGNALVTSLDKTTAFAASFDREGNFVI